MEITEKLLSYKAHLDASDITEKLSDIEKTVDRITEKVSRLKSTLTEVAQTADGD